VHPAPACLQGRSRTERARLPRARARHRAHACPLLGASQATRSGSGMIRDGTGTRRWTARFARRSVPRAGLSVRHEVRRRRVQARPPSRRRRCRPFQ